MADSNNSRPNSSSSPQGDQSSSSNGRGNRKLFEDGSYEKYTQKLFAAAKSSYEAGDTTQQTQRKLLETFHASLVQINEDLDKKLSQNQNQNQNQK